MTATNGSGSPAAAWHTARPWTPPLSLIVREISSVSATFILSFSIPDLNRELGASSLIHDDDELDGSKSSRKRSSFISEILAKRLFSVNVNGTPWQRILVRVAESGDEAVVIIYGLLPGRQYDIDLGLVQDGQNSTIRSQFTTEDRDHQVALDAHIESELTALDNTPDSPSPDRSRRGSSHSSSPSTSSSSSFTTDSESSHTSHSGSARSASPSASSDTPSPSVLPDSTEEHVNQLQQALDALRTEEETLTANLKSVRRESQKADAALRGEIEVLRRASEKHAVAEQRAKQKILALQEAHKRAVAATQETEQELGKVEASLPDLIKAKGEKEKEYEKLEAEAVKVRKERERIEEAERKQIESMNAELASVKHKLEKLGGKKDKLETGTIPDLEGQLEDITEEIEKMEAEERDLDRALAEASAATTHHIKPIVDEMGMLQLPGRSVSQIPQQQRSRHNSVHSGPPSMTSGQRMPASGTQPLLHHQSQQSWSVPCSSRRQQHSPRTYTYPQSNHTLPNGRSHQPQQTPIILTNPHRKPGTVIQPPHTHNSSPSHGGLIKSSGSDNAPSPPTSPPSKSSAAQPTSMLSSRAPAFEPGAGLGILLKGGSLPSRTTGYGSGSGSSSSSIGKSAAAKVQRSSVGNATFNVRGESTGGG
ncbi:hypothetical protein JOM56_012250 [Amanita muscaria]